MKPAQPVISLRPIQRAMSHVLVSEDTQHVFYTLSNGKLWNTQVSNIMALARVRAEVQVKMCQKIWVKITDL